MDHDGRGVRAVCGIEVPTPADRTARLSNRALQDAEMNPGDAPQSSKELRQLCQYFLRPEVVRKIRPLTKIFFAVHLMCSCPEMPLNPFAEAGADNITIHVELGDKVTPLLWKIRSLGRQVGLAINSLTAIAGVRS